MIDIDHLIVGAGMTGLAYANFVRSSDYLILEKEDEIGGWCKTVHQDGFVWDYSGHFFHFRQPEIEAYLRKRMPSDEVVTVTKNSLIYFDGCWVDFPFQKNIHQLPKQDFIDCLYDLYFREDGEASSFKQMLYQKFGAAISEKFLIPYNEKLYACDLDSLDADAMGRFFPYANLDEILRNMKRADNDSYNATFTYPKNGAIMYVNALKSEIPDEKVRLGEGLESVDVDAKIATTTSGEKIRYKNLISSAPLHHFLDIVGEPNPGLGYNKVLVFNLGFDSKGMEGVHWVYFPSKDVSFYRIGFYDNIQNTDRMSLYVELGFEPDATYDVDAELKRVMADLSATGIVTDQHLVSHHSVTLDPAYAHINSLSRELYSQRSESWNQNGVYSIGRYGGWTYCSIEDNIIEAKALAESLSG